MSDTRDPETDQALPAINPFKYIQDIAIQQFMDRKQHGIRKYGTALQPFNGRNALQDLREELQDALLYCIQLEQEQQPEFTEDQILLDRNYKPWYYKVNGDIFLCNGEVYPDFLPFASWRFMNANFGPMLVLQLPEGSPNDISGNQEESDPDSGDAPGGIASV